MNLSPFSLLSRLQVHLFDFPRTVTTPYFTEIPGNGSSRLSSLGRTQRRRSTHFVGEHAADNDDDTFRFRYPGTRDAAVQCGNAINHAVDSIPRESKATLDDNRRRRVASENSYELVHRHFKGVHYSISKA